MPTCMTSRLRLSPLLAQRPQRTALHYVPVGVILAKWDLCVACPAALFLNPLLFIQNNPQRRPHRLVACLLGRTVVVRGRNVVDTMGRSRIADIYVVL